MLEFLKESFEQLSATALITRIVFAIFATLVYFMFFYYAKKRNLQLFTLIVITLIVALFGLSFFVDSSELKFYLNFELLVLCVLGFLLFMQDLNRNIFRLSLKSKNRDNPIVHVGTEDLSHSVSEIIKACLRLSKTDTGALIVITDHMSKEILESGVRVNADITAELLETLFFPKTPLHDGAVIVTANKVDSAGCYLPLTQAQNLPREFGTRHRAAIGVSSAFPDATAIVVSEETGIISAMHDGKVKRYLDTKQLKAILDCAMGLADESAEERIWGEDRK
ncbi:MAG: diadenylate cyclase [Clostridiales bacterium]|nr:diadenylate cyclase [Clostridiales bacterium]